MALFQRLGDLIDKAKTVGAARDVLALQACCVLSAPVCEGALSLGRHLWIPTRHQNTRVFSPRARASPPLCCLPQQFALLTIKRRFTRDAPPAAAVAAAATPPPPVPAASADSAAMDEAKTSSGVDGGAPKKPAPFKAAVKRGTSKVKALWAEAKEALALKKKAKRAAPAAEAERDNANVGDGSAAAAPVQEDAPVAAAAVVVAVVVPAGEPARKAGLKGKAAFKGVRVSLKAALRKIGKGMCFAP